MPNPGGFGELGFAQAALAIEVALRTHFGTHWRCLDPAELTALYARRQFARGWRIDFAMKSGETRAVDLLIGANFPAGYPRTALVDGPGQLVYPHVEYDGILCLLPILAEVDAERPDEVAIHLVARSVRLIEELAEGSIIDRDFREEFLTYWAYAAGKGSVIHSLVSPEGPSRKIAVWRDAKGMTVVGEDKPSLEAWIMKRFGRSNGGKHHKIEAATLLWLPEPPVPVNYPATGADLLRLAGIAGGDAQAVLVEAAGTVPDPLTVLIVAEGRGGPGLIGVTTTAGRKSRERHGRVEKPLLKGFSASGLPPEIAAFRTFSAAPVEKWNVARADAAWIHGRGRDGRTPVLLEKTVSLVGCGSIGSSLAVLLARAGIGTLHIVDYDDLDWPNVGRHELGATAIGKNKAEMLAGRLQAEFPHLAILGHDISAHALISGYKGVLEASDLVIAATGSWDAESALNRWHSAQGKAPILYGWTEKHALAGHAVLIASDGACLRCGIGQTGIPAFTATAWPDGEATIEEPACGNHYAPYGATELAFVNALIAEMALDALIEPFTTSTHRIWLAPEARLKAKGGEWSNALKREFPSALAGGLRLERLWPSSECKACGNYVSTAA
jgi:molybdopterin/thiamine biosynthesis adenylyltransferase